LLHCSIWLKGIAVNKKALHDYDILEKLEAGIVLTGAETKSAKTGGLNLRGAHMIIRGGRLTSLARK